MASPRPTPGLWLTPFAGALVLCVCALIAAPAVAVGATATVVTKYYSDPTGDGCSKYAMCEYRELHFAASPGEINTVTVSEDASSGMVVIRDTTASVVPGAGCSAVDEHAVSCTPAPPVMRTGDLSDSVTFTLRWGARADGGAGDDRLAGGTSSSGVALSGGAGNDTLTGAASVDVLLGGSGDDVLEGGAGKDQLSGGGGRDTLLAGAGADWITEDDTSGAADSDRLDGGSGLDTVDYSARVAALAVRLGGASPSGGQGDERDELPSVEKVVAGSGDDRLRGSEGPDAIWGGGGADRISGEGGDDELAGQAGRDAIRGGPGRDGLFGSAGNDTLLARDGERDVLRGDSGRDRAHFDKGLDRVFSVSTLF